MSLIAQASLSPSQSTAHVPVTSPALPPPGHERRDIRGRKEGWEWQTTRGKGKIRNEQASSSGTLSVCVCVCVCLAGWSCFILIVQAQEYLVSYIRTKKSSPS
jgi:hypothetical protein